MMRGDKKTQCPILYNQILQKKKLKLKECDRDYQAVRIKRSSTRGKQRARKKEASGGGGGNKC